MPNRENQDDILGRDPPIFRDIAELSPGKNQFPAPVLRFAAQQRVISKQLESAPNTEHPLARHARVLLCKEMKEALEVGERPGRYLDFRQAPARGRRTVFPAARASR